MAPPRATKKSSLTSVSQVTTRQGLQQLRRQVIEEVGDLDEVDDAHAMHIDSHGQEEEPVDLQSAKDGPLEALLADMVDGQRKRHSKRKEGVDKAYGTSHETVQNAINAVSDAHQGKAYAAHEAHLKRLQELIGQKTKIETAMSDKLASLRANYDAHSRDLEAVVDRRIKELK